MIAADRLQESRDFWEKSLEHDKNQLKLSIILGSSGLMLTGFGIGLAITGHPEGALAIGTGGAFTYVGAKEAIDDFQNCIQSNERVAAREGMAKGIDIVSSSSRDV